MPPNTQVVQEPLPPLPPADERVAPLPRSARELQGWVQRELGLSKARATRLLEALESVLGQQHRQWEASKEEALKALCEGFAIKLERLQEELLAKDMTVSNIARYFEELVADLTDKSRRDPKTKLMNFDWFMERLESFLAVEQRVRYCGIGVVDIGSFKWYNDNLGHALGDRIIQQVAVLLAEQIRSQDMLTQDRSGPRHDLHARFGGDEFCFVIPDIPEREVAYGIASRFKQRVEQHDWALEDTRLSDRPVRVDVGLVRLELGPLADRRAHARTLASELINRADQLMYNAKQCAATDVYVLDVRIDAGTIVEVARHPDARED